MSQSDNYYLFGCKPLQYAVIDPVSCTGCGWCAMFCPVQCMYQRPDGFYDLETDKCIGCKSCMKIGCPAISFRYGKAVIDHTTCVGCGVCQQLCPVSAIEKPESK